MILHSQEDAEEMTAYTANPLNQYTVIQQGSGEEGEESFAPIYDADGNQTRIKTATGIWTVTYNAENRPTRFESEDGATVIDCTYDYLGRRHTRKVTVNGSVSNFLRYIYRGYLQIAAIDAISGVFRWFIFWDPTQPTATRPLAIRKDSTWYAYGWDITKNVTEIFGKAGYLRTAYTYTPYGTATAEGDVTQPLTWSSEYSDEELALIYYNYRHYNPTDGRWINRDPIAEQGGVNLYAFVRNMPINWRDLFGLWSTEWKLNPSSRRIYYANKNDTKQGLAKLVGLDVNEFDKWAIPVSKQRNEDGLFCRYSVPNKWVAADFLRGGGFLARFVNVGGTLGVFFGTDLSTYGLKVVKPKTVEDLKKELNSDVWGIVVFGHGSMYSDEIFDGAGNPMITQNYIRNEIAKNGYKLAKVYMMQCYSALNGNRTLWQQHSIYLKDYDGINCILFDI